MKWLLIVVFQLITFALFAQEVDISLLKFKDYYKDNEPTWETCNNDSQLFKKDTLTFYSDWFVEKCCETFQMRIKRKKVKEAHYYFGCMEPPAISAYYGKNRLSGKIRKKNGVYFLTILRGEKEIFLKFRITELNKSVFYDSENYPREYLLMKLVRNE